MSTTRDEITMPVDEEVESAELLHGRSDGTLPVAVVGDVEFHESGGGTGLPDGVGSRATVLLEDVADHDRRTGVGEGGSHTGAQPLRTTGDQRFPSCKITHAHSDLPSYETIRGNHVTRSSPQCGVDV